MDDRVDKTNRAAIKQLNQIKKWGIGETFGIRRPDWPLLGLTLLIFAGFLLLGELLFRTEIVAEKLTGPRFGGRHKQFEVQLARLEKRSQAGEQIDCIFLGNSMIWLDVDPLIVNQAYKQQTGQEIHCFNFGVSALPASSAALVAHMLVGKYQPRVLIYGTSARDYAVPVEAEDAHVISDTPWLNYQNGALNMIGWLYDHSNLFRYLGHLHDIVLLRFPEVIANNNGYLPHDYGFDPKREIRVDVIESPDFDETGNTDLIKWFYHYEVREENLEGLRQIIGLREYGTEVIIIEMPFHESGYGFFLNGAQDYEKFVQQVDQITTLTGTPLWRIADQPAIPSQGWWDYTHLNIEGAEIFSQWLGEKLSEPKDKRLLTE
jgi:hypothetical protein